MNATLPPKLPVAAVQAALREVFGLEGDLVALDGERDQNFRLTTADRNLVVKVCNPAEGQDIAAAQTAALRHIAGVDPGLPVPRVVPSHQQESLPSLHHLGVTYPLLVLEWLPGRVMGATDFDAAHYATLGRLLGRLTRSLRGFVNPSFASRQLAWNTAHFCPASDDMSRLPAAARARVASIAQQFRDTVQPVLPGLPAQIIHGDVHPFNTLLDEDGAISGIIDFGDMIHAPRILDLSNALADCLLPGQDPVKVLGNMIPGYLSHLPLEETEIDLILPLMRARLALTMLVTARRRALGAEVTPQITALDNVSLDVLQMLDGEHLPSVIRDAASGILKKQAPMDGNILDRRMKAMGRKPLLFYDEPLHIVKGEGVWLTAADGRRYLDCYNNVPHVGHSNLHVAEAVARQLRRLNTNTRYLTDEALTYAERIKATLDPSLDTVIFVNSGSEANDVAWRMANVCTGARGALCMDFAYHGVTMAADMLSPSNYPPGKWQAPLVRQLEAPDTYRGRFRASDAAAGETYAAAARIAIRELQDEGHGLSIAIIDSAFMTNGILDVPNGYVAAVRGHVHAMGGLFIADEVQSGFGRMGTKLWGHQHHGVVPDFVTIGKPAGNGYPLGLVITRAEIHERFVAETGPFFSTFGGSNAACSAGLAVLDVMEHEGLLANSLETGRYFRDRLRAFMTRHQEIGDVRGSGLAIGVELVRNRETLEPAVLETRRVINALRHRGVLVGSDGKLGNVLKIRPPLVFRRADADIAVDALDRVLAHLP